MKKINCILLVDDNPADNEYHKIIIEEAEACNHIKIAEDGVKALEYIMNSAKPGNEQDYPMANLIFLDINMPRMNGFEFLREYQKLDDKLKSACVIIMLTTSSNPDDKEKSKTYKEVPSFMTKPLTVEMVRGIIEEYF